MKNELDRSIIDAAIQGDSQAFAKIYESYRGLVLGVSRKMLKNPEDAEDLMQRVFMQVMRKIHTYKYKSSFTTWLYRVTYTQGLMWLREHKKDAHNVSLEFLEESAAEDGRQKDLADAIGIEDNNLRATVDRVTINRIIPKLATGYRTILKMHDLMGLQHKEIAPILGISIGASKSQLYKARHRVKEQLSCHSPKKARKARLQKMPLTIVKAIAAAA